MPNIIERISGLLERATAAPWEADTTDAEDCVIWASAEDNNKFLANVGSDRMVPVRPDGAALLFDMDVTNAKLTVELRNAAPALMDALNAAKELCDAYETIGPGLTMSKKAVALRSKLAVLEEL